MEVKVKMAMLVGMLVAHYKGNLNLYARRDIFVQCLELLLKSEGKVTSEDSKAVEKMIDEAVAQYNTIFC